MRYAIAYLDTYYCTARNNVCLDDVRFVVSSEVS